MVKIKVVLLIIAGCFLFSTNQIWAQNSGEQLFMSNCFACHTIGEGRRVGPDLVGAHERRSREWLEQFVKSSTTMVEDGDAQAVAVFTEFSKLVMPDATISNQQIKQVLDYIKTKSESVASNSEATSSAEVVDQAVAETPSQTASESLASEPFASEQFASEQEIQKGSDYFQGKLRFDNSGPACNACHDVQNDAVIGGGILAAELTTVFSRMGGPGVEAILGQSPFPVMKAAYQDKPLQEEEITRLIDFLQYADSQHAFQQPRDYGIGLFTSGIVGASVLFLFFAINWRGRKRGSVNQDIYDRQIKSE